MSLLQLIFTGLIAGDRIQNGPALHIMRASHIFCRPRRAKKEGRRRL